MPAEALRADLGRDLERFSAIGAYDQTAGSSFVRHVALLRGAGRVRRDDLVAVYEQGPPLDVGPSTSAQFGIVGESSTPAHVAGWIPLRLEEEQRLSRFLAVIDREKRPDTPYRSYCIRPAFRYEKFESSSPKGFHRFSCAGLVDECYRRADVPLIRAGGGALGMDFLPVGLEILMLAYPDQIKRLVNADLRRRVLNLPGDGPWNILLPGYLLHSLARTEEQIRAAPYFPDDGDAWFP